MVESHNFDKESTKRYNKVNSGHFCENLERFHIFDYLFVLSMVFAIEEINRDPKLLPNVTLGFQIFDSCYSRERALLSTLSFLTGKHDLVPNYSCETVSLTPAIIGDALSSSSLIMATVLGLYRYPQVSYGSSVSLLSDKLLYPSFVRTVPNDVFQAIGLAQMLIYFGWTWVGILASDNDYGILGGETLQREIIKAGGCISFTEKVTKDKEKHSSLVNVIQQTSTTVIVVYSTSENLVPLLEAISAQNVTGRIWVSTTGWIVSPDVLSMKTVKMLNGSVGFYTHKGRIPGLTDFLYSIHPFNFPNDIFMTTFWEEAFGCQWLKSDGNTTLLNSATNKKALSCTSQEDLRKLSISVYDVYNFTYMLSTYNAAYVVAHSLHSMFSCRNGKGPFQNGECGSIHDFQSWKLHHYTKNVNFKNTGGEQMYFDANGDPPARYDILNFALLPDGTNRYLQVGSFENKAIGRPDLTINVGDILWNERFNQIIHEPFANGYGQDNEELPQSPDRDGSLGISSLLGLGKIPGCRVALSYSDSSCFKTAVPSSPKGGIDESGNAYFSDSIRVPDQIDSIAIGSEQVLAQREFVECSDSVTVPLMEFVECSDSVTIPLMEFVECFDSVTVPLMEFVECFDSVTVPLMEFMEYSDSVKVPLMEFVECFDSVTFLLMEFVECPEFVKVPLMEFVKIFDSVTVPLMEFVECSDSVTVPLMEFVECSDSVTFFFPQIPHSVCSESCLPGYQKASRRGQPLCCFDCLVCSKGEITNKTDSVSCLKCTEDFWTNEKRDMCIPKILDYLSYEDPIGTSLLFSSSALSVLTVSVLCIFIKFKNTPIVKANNRELSYFLLLALALCFLCCLLFIGHPMKLNCMFRQVVFGITFSLCVSCILAKTVIVMIAFSATKPGSRLRNWVGSRVSIPIVITGSLVQVIICFVWLSVSAPFPEFNKTSEEGKIIIGCNEGSTFTFWIMLGYLGLLAVVSFVVAFLARNLPGSFNEAKYITFSMLVFVSVWLSFIPAYLSTKGKYMVAVELFAILASSAGMLGCIFLPKCYILILRPELNTRGYMVEKN
ncbi:uncharacterized protein LOC122805971 [Protopterus annectens]|uniref:uncharacterized protein LOC122805971 n=1 Tax=Protopterus annectens TaxID=7888 RepID=UPI001CFBC159|nr:uncharacterized protein LOC122805971 [Protopterus annectens]